MKKNNPCFKIMLDDSEFIVKFEIIPEKQKTKCVLCLNDFFSPREWKATVTCQEGDVYSESEGMHQALIATLNKYHEFNEKEYNKYRKFFEDKQAYRYPFGIAHKLNRIIRRREKHGNTDDRR